MESSKAKELIGYSFLVVFANDDQISERELAMLEKLALEDHQIDESEKEALTRIFARADQEMIAEKVMDEIESFKNQYGID